MLFFVHVVLMCPRTGGALVNNSNSRNRRVLAVLAIVIVVHVPLSLVYAQVAGATLSGSITHASMAALVPGQVPIKKVPPKTPRVVTSHPPHSSPHPRLPPGEHLP